MNWEKASPVIAVFGIIAVLLVVTQIGLYQANIDLGTVFGGDRITSTEAALGFTVSLDEANVPSDEEYATYEADSDNIEWQVLGTVGSSSEVVFDARKDSAGTITKGSAVHLAGYNPSGYIEVEEADADDPARMPAIGLAVTDLTSSSTGQIVLVGELAGLATTGFVFGDDLFVSTTPGVLTATKPVGNSVQIQRIAEVARVHGSQGVLEVFGAGRANDLPNITDDSIWIGSATDVPTNTAIGDCDDSGGNHLNYDTATNTLSCGTTNNPVAAFTSGTIDDVTIGGSTPAAGTFTNVGVGIAPLSVLHIKASIPGTIGDKPAGQLVIQSPTNDVDTAVVITAYKSDGSGDPDVQLWYLGSSSTSNENITFLNRRNGTLTLATNDTDRLTISGSGTVDLQNNDLTNIGNAGTDITSTGATFAVDLSVGASAANTTFRFPTDNVQGVTAGATSIGESTGTQSSGFAYVMSFRSDTNFTMALDVLIWWNNSYTVVATSGNNMPRTYSAVSGQLKVAFATGTHDVAVMQIRMPSPN